VAVVLCIGAFVYYKRAKSKRALSALTPANVPANPATPAKASVNPPLALHADHAVKEVEEVVVVKGHVYSPA
jgi:hypothetical protein